MTPFSEIKPATIDENFVTEENIKKAIEHFPDPDWHGKPQDLADIKHQIKQMSDEIDEIIEKYSFPN